jgi:lipopolysaccharide export system protein LptC
VVILKVLLPLTALAVLSTLFLLSRSGTQTAIIPFAEQEVARRVEGQQVTGPHYSGLTNAGEEISVKARVARPGRKGEPAFADDLTAALTTKDGDLVTLTSESGRFDLEADIATFMGNVLMETSTGFTVTTQELTAALDRIAGSTPGEISGSGPIGTFWAGEMELTSKNDGGPVHLHFKNGVKLVYEPKNAE